MNLVIHLEPPVIAFSDVPIIGLIIGITHYRPLFFLISVSVISERCNQYYKKCVIIASLIAFMTLRIIEKKIFFVERIRNQ